MLFVNEAGEVFVRSEALHALNSSMLHVVATAVDSGNPPRQVPCFTIFFTLCSYNYHRLRILKNIEDVTHVTTKNLS